MKRYAELLADALARVREIMPWDLRDRLAAGRDMIVLDVREPAEFEAAHIAGSINVPRGVLEQACEWDYDETVPELADGRERAIVVVCRSGHRSVLAADVLQTLGFADVVSLKTGVRGWNDFEQPLVDAAGRPIDSDAAERLLAARVRPEQRRPAQARGAALVRPTMPDGGDAPRSG
jgi:rhodanese-related sulfurtransferase